jgi:hypothetical protein
MFPGKADTLECVYKTNILKVTTPTKISDNIFLNRTGRVIYYIS